MPLVAAAICPHPPLLVPEVAAGAAGELDDLRVACDAAVAHLLAADPDQVLTVGSGPEPSGAEVGRPDLPLSRAIGAWLLARADVAVSRLGGQTVPPAATADECRARGEALAGTPARIALLVMGDGTACRGVSAPGYDDPRAEPFDATVAGALARPDIEALLGIDPVLAAELRCAGRAPWQVLAAALAADARPWTGALHYDRAPYGVGYFVVTLSPSTP